MSRKPQLRLAKPNRVDESVAKKLEAKAEAAGTRRAGTSAKDAMKRSQTSSGVPRRRGGKVGEHLVVERQQGQKRRRTLYMPLDVDARLVEYCNSEGREASAVISKAVAEYLDRLPV